MSEAASSSCRNTPPTSTPSVFAKFKTLLRKAGARTYEAISDACGKILANYPPAECAAYLKNRMFGKMLASSADFEWGAGYA